MDVELSRNKNWALQRHHNLLVERNHMAVL